MAVGAGPSGAGPSSSAGPKAKHDPKNQPWIEKYRPKTLDDVAANKEIIDTIKRLTDENRLPHLLLYGPPGVHCHFHVCLHHLSSCKTNLRRVKIIT